MSTQFVCKDENSLKPDFKTTFVLVQSMNALSNSYLKCEQNFVQDWNNAEPNVWYCFDHNGIKNWGCSIKFWEGKTFMRVRFIFSTLLIIIIIL